MARIRSTVDIYVISEVGGLGPSKIGITQNISKRVSNLQNGNPRKIMINGRFTLLDREAALAVEWIALAKFKTLGLSLSGEWVGVAPDLVRIEIQAILDELGEQYIYTGAI